MGKKYLETKKGSLESSILGVWQDAIEEGDARVSAARMDGRTTEYKSHRAKLETARTRRENKKVSVKEEQITPNQIEESFLNLGEQVDDDGLVEWTLDQEEIIEQILDMPDDQFDDLLEEMSDEQLIVFEGILGAIGRGLKKAGSAVGKRMTSSGRADIKHKKAQKKADTVDKKIATKQLKKDTKQKKKEAGIGIAGKIHKGKEKVKKGAAKVKAGAQKVGAAIKKSAEEVDFE